MIKRSETQWRALFSEHESSGLSASAFCREHSLCPKYFSLRKRQLGWTGSSSFVQVAPRVDEAVVVAGDVPVRVVEVRIPIDHLSEVLSDLFR